MSTDWNVHCRDCGETHTFHDANHEESAMVALCRNAAAIAALVPLFDDMALAYAGIYLQTPWGHIDVAWFANHASHRLAPISEYGQILGTCSESVPCECGSRHRKCVLVPGHDGDHQART